jgi:hypothetical protein
VPAATSSISFDVSMMRACSLPFGMRP